MSFESAESGDSPISAMDLALYAEGLLDSAGCARVEGLLQRYPQLRGCCAGWSGVDASVLSEDGRGVATERVAELEMAERPVSSRRNWVSLSAAVLLVTAVVAAWRNAEAGAFDATLSVTERTLQTAGAELPIELQRSRQSLERLQKSFWISDQQMRRRNRLLAESILAQVGMERKHVTPLAFADRPDLYPPLELCGQAVALLRDVESHDVQSRAVLTDALCTTSEIRGWLAAVQRFQRDLPFSDQYAMSAAAALDGLRSAPDGRQRLMLLNLLFRAAHKGALNGRLPAAGGGLVPAEPVLLPQLRELLLSLPGDSVETAVNDWKQLSVPLGMAISRLPVSSFQDHLAMMGICNTLGMRLRAEHLPAQLVLQQGIQLAEQVSGAEQDLTFQLTYGRLLGNLADNMAGSASIPDELAQREKAVQHFRGVTRRMVSQELQSELCWVTARQLLLLYVAEKQGLQPASRVDEYLGALKQITDDLTSFEGAQMSLHEIELIRAIHADREGRASLGQGLVHSARAAEMESRGSIADQEVNRRLFAAFRDSAYCCSQPEFASILKMYGIE